MDKILMELEINKYGLMARLVREEDAEFILGLRTNPQLSRFLNPTENNVEKQKAYIKAYKEKEKIGEDFYYIFFYNNEPAGVARLYNLTEKTFTFGSWLFAAGFPYWVSCAGAIILREIAYDVLGKEKEVDNDGTHEENKGVLSFSRLLGMNYDGYRMGHNGKYLTGYMLKEDFERNKQRIIRTFPNK